MTGLPSEFDHDHYEELCALATAGSLTAAESAALFSHLDECPQCNQHFIEYQSLASEGMPMLADLRAPASNLSSFDEQGALARLRRNVAAVNTGMALRTLPLSQSRRTNAWRGFIAASLIAGVAFASYRIGELRHAKSTGRIITPSAQQRNTGQQHPESVTPLRDAEQRELDLQVIADQRWEELKKLRSDAKDAQERLDNLAASLAAARADSTEQIKAATEQRDDLTNRLQNAQQLYATAQDELNVLHLQRKQDLARITSLEGQVGGLTVALNEQSNRSKEDEQFLSSDKDIRDLIGARNLYIADIMDVSEDGSAKRPFGRVFYTKTKSLVFYAYDLDRQPGVKQASTFHVWGRTGPDDRRPMSLGVLYMDSESNSRWTLRVNNPEQLSRLDAVFVTVEPHERTDKPTGKPFLYASLKREPNHP
jgi:hypothetical protein